VVSGVDCHIGLPFGSVDAQQCSKEDKAAERCGVREAGGGAGA